MPNMHANRSSPPRSSGPDTGLVVLLTIVMAVGGVFVAERWWFRGALAPSVAEWLQLGPVRQQIAPHEKGADAHHCKKPVAPQPAASPKPKPVKRPPARKKKVDPLVRYVNESCDYLKGGNEGAYEGRRMAAVIGLYVPPADRVAER